MIGALYSYRRYDQDNPWFSKLAVLWVSGSQTWRCRNWFTYAGTGNGWRGPHYQ